MSKNRSKLVCILITVTLILQTVNAQDSWQFIVTGDSRGTDNGVNATILSELASEVIDKDVDLLLFAGDLIHGGYDPQTQLNNWLTIMKPVYDANIGVYVIRGNHEDIGFFPDISVWHNTFSGSLAMPQNGPPGEENLTYSFTHKNAFIAGLDQYINLNQVNQPWLDDQLAANPNPHVFVFGHLPAFQAMPRFGMGMDVHPQERDAFWESLQKAGARLYWCSHDHSYDHARIDDGDGDIENDLHQYIIGTAGAPLYSWPVEYKGDNSFMTPVNVLRSEMYGYVIVEINGLDVTVTWMQRDTRDLLIKGIYQPAEVWGYSVPEITLLSPNGNEQLIAESDYLIEWQTYPHAGIQEVRLEYYDGDTWQGINANPLPANSGSYLWDPIPAVDSDQCLLRISDWNNASLSDTSDSKLTIFQCRLMLADLNKDCYVDMKDLMLLAADWLRCGNRFDAACNGN